MKLLFVAVSCMRDDVVEMTVNIVETAISHDLTEDGWSLGTRLN